MSEPVVRASLSSNYFLDCSNSNAVSKESSLKALFGYFKMPIFFSILKYLKAKSFEGLQIQLLTSLHSLLPVALGQVNLAQKAGSQIMQIAGNVLTLLLHLFCLDLHTNSP